MMNLDSVGTYWAERDDDVIAAMRAKAVEFWNDCIIGGDGYDTAWRYTYFGPSGNDDNRDVEARYTY